MSPLYVSLIAGHRVGANVARGYAELYDLVCDPDQELELEVGFDSDTNLAFHEDVPVLLEGSVYLTDGFRDFSDVIEARMTPTLDPLGRRAQPPSRRTR